MAFRNSTCIFIHHACIWTKHKIPDGEVHPFIAFAAFLILVFGFTLPFWLNTLFRKIVVDESGIMLKRSLNFKIPYLYEFDLFYPFKELEWVRAKWIFVDIKGKSIFTNPRWIIVQNSRAFVKAVKKYAPELVNKMEVSK